MPKLKTNKAVRKRFKISANGKVRMQKTKRRHLLSYKPSRQKRKLRGWVSIDANGVRQIKQALPYG